MLDQLFSKVSIFALIYHCGVSKAGMRSRWLIMRRREDAVSDKPEFLLGNVLARCLRLSPRSFSLVLTSASWWGIWRRWTAISERWSGQAIQLFEVWRCAVPLEVPATTTTHSSNPETSLPHQVTRVGHAFFFYLINTCILIFKFGHRLGWI